MTRSPHRRHLRLGRGHRPGQRGEAGEKIKVKPTSICRAARRSWPDRDHAQLAWPALRPPFLDRAESYALVVVASRAGSSLHHHRRTAWRAGRHRVDASSSPARTSGVARSTAPSCAWAWPQPIPSSSSASPRSRWPRSQPERPRSRRAALPPRHHDRASRDRHGAYVAGPGRRRRTGERAAGTRVIGGLLPGAAAGTLALSPPSSR